MLNPPYACPPASGLLYLHGFNSGAGSPKAALMRAACRRLGVPCQTPQLPHRPGAAFALAEALLAGLGPAPLVAGSSLGGFLATCLAERHALSAALINPAVRPATLVAGWVGEAFVNHDSGERFTVGEAHLAELEALTPERITAPERYLLLLGSRDETLDPAQAFALYRGARTIVHPRSDHGFDVLADYLPAIFAHGGHRLAPGRLPDQDLDMDDA